MARRRTTPPPRRAGVGSDGDDASAADAPAPDAGSGDGGLWPCAPPADPTQPHPTLAATGCMDTLAITRFASGAYGYEINSPLWSDLADKERAFVLPPGRQDSRGQLRRPAERLPRRRRRRQVGFPRRHHLAQELRVRRQARRDPPAGRIARRNLGRLQLPMERGPDRGHAGRERGRQRLIQHRQPHGRLDLSGRRTAPSATPAAPAGRSGPRPRR